MSLAFEQVTYKYDDDRDECAIDGASFEVADGEFVGVVGHTGSGKSTLAELACAVKRPTSGTVRIDGIATSDKKRRRELRRLVGYVMQYPEYQLFAETVAEDVGFGPANLGMGKAEVDTAVREALDLVGLDYDEVAEASPFDLSGGQKRRVALAGIIAMHPRILCVDEPMAGLDPRGRDEILGIVAELHHRGATVIMVSHSMDDVARLASRVIVLDHGRVADDGDPATVFSHKETLRRAGLDVPRATQVADDLAGHGFTLGDARPLTLEALARAIANELGTRGSDAPDARATTEQDDTREAGR